MAVLLKATSAGVYGTTYTVQIMDTEYVGTAVDVDLGGEGFNVSYNTENDEHPHSAIISSECTFSIVRTSSNNSILSTFVTDLISAEEGRFRVKILDSTDGLYWCGYILADQVVEQDRDWADINSFFKIRAKDGINRLKTIDYNNSGTAYSGRETLLQHLFKVLDKIGTDDFFGTNDDYLLTVCNWYEANMVSPTTSDDPLSLVYFDHLSAITRDRDGTETFKSSYEILETICTIKGARFYFSNGSYRFDQVGEYRKGDGSLIRHRYRKAGTKISTQTTLDIRSSETNGDFIRAAQGEYTYFAPLRAVEIEFNHRNDFNYLEGMEWSNSESLNVYLGAVGTENLAFRIQGVISSNLNTTPFNQVRNVFKIEVNLTIGATDYYLKRNYTLNSSNIIYDDAEWTTNSIDRLYIVTPIQAFNDTVTYENVDFVTPNIPNDAALSLVNFQVTYDTSLEVSSQDVPSIINSFTWLFTNSVLQLYKDGTGAPTEKTITRLDNPVSSNFSDTLEIKTLIGDSPDLLTSAALTVKNVSNEDIPAEEWNNGLSGTGRLIQRLLLAEIMKLRKKALLKWRGTIIDASSFSYDRIMWLTTGNEFVPLTVSYNSATESWEGEWFNTDYDITAITDTAQDFNFAPGFSPPGFITNGPVVPWDTSADPIASSFTTGGQLIGITDDGIVEGETVTTIPIQAVGVGGLVNSGDIIKLVTSGGQTQSFTVDADLGPTDTSISVVSTTALITAGSGSYVTTSVDSFVQNVQNSVSVTGKVNRYRQIYDNVTTTSLTVTENGGTLPANTDLIDVHYNGRLLSEGASNDYEVSGSNINFTFTPRGTVRVMVTFWIID
jgi:archaellum component FlaF (FlaF/FlaG flagellin family)